MARTCSDARADERRLGGERRAARDNAAGPALRALAGSSGVGCRRSQRRPVPAGSEIDLRLCAVILVRAAPPSSKRRVRSDPPDRPNAKCQRQRLPPLPKDESGCSQRSTNPRVGGSNPRGRVGSSAATSAARCGAARLPPPVEGCGSPACRRSDRRGPGPPATSGGGAPSGPTRRTRRRPGRRAARSGRADSHGGPTVGRRRKRGPHGPRAGRVRRAASARTARA
jgi:hypothetical protein